MPETNKQKNFQNDLCMCVLGYACNTQRVIYNRAFDFISCLQKAWKSARGET